VLTVDECPKCESKNIGREKMPFGRTFCLDCNHVIVERGVKAHKAFDDISRAALSPAPIPPDVLSARAEIADLPDGITSDEGQVGGFDFESYRELNGYGKEVWAKEACAKIAELEKALSEKSGKASGEKAGLCPKCGFRDVYLATASAQIEFVGDQDGEHSSAFNIEDVELCAHYCGSCEALIDIAVTEPCVSQAVENQRKYTESEVVELIERAQDRTLREAYKLLRGEVDTKRLGRAVRNALAKISLKRLLAVSFTKDDGEPEVSNV